MSDKREREQHFKRLNVMDDNTFEFYRNRKGSPPPTPQNKILANNCPSMVGQTISIY
jgi:hypothetical protein